MACSHLIRDSMRFMRYFLLSNLLRPYSFAFFAKFYQNCFSGLEVKALYRIFVPKK
jgi:hypothetical protein